MSIFLNKDSKVIVQGITGGEGTKHTARMLAAGPNVVGGVNARKAGTTVTHNDKDGNDVELPVFGYRRRGDGSHRRRRLGRVRAAGIHQGCCDRGHRRRASACSSSSPRAFPSRTRPSSGLTPRPRVASDPHHRTELPRHHHRRARRSLASLPPTSPGKGPIGLVSKSGTLTYQMMYELRDLGLLHRYRYRWRPDHRHHAHRCARGVRERPRDQGDRHDRRDRW